MKQVSTQASSAPRQTPTSGKIAEMINNLSCDLIDHAQNHSATDAFVATCAECIYWAAKVAQNPHVWQGYYHTQQARNLKQLPLEVINEAITRVATTDNTSLRAHPFNSQEYLQVVFA